MGVAASLPGAYPFNVKDPAITSETRGRLDALTGARFLAALQVLLFHYGSSLAGAGVAPWIERVRSRGFVAVSFFFALSGFVLAYQYTGAALNGRLESRSFWVNRFARVYPAYLVGLVALVPLALFKPWGTATHAFGDASVRAKAATGIAHLLMVQGWFPRLVASWNIPGWSLCVEIFFYALFPLVAVLVVRASSRNLVGLLGVAWVASLLAPLLYLLRSPDHLTVTSDGSFGLWLLALKFCPLVRLPEFVFGVALGVLFLRSRDRAASGSWMAALGFGLAGACLALLPLPYPLLHNGLLLPLFGLAIVGLARGGGLLGKVLAARPLVALGEASYALYILQVPLMYWMLLASGASPRSCSPISASRSRPRSRVIDGSSSRDGSGCGGG
jgi:peptidoglycan/LPS O-acetylase OafA/YrhL